MTGRAKTLYEAVGGTDALRRLSNTFYDGVLADPLLAPVLRPVVVAYVPEAAKPLSGTHTPQRL